MLVSPLEVEFSVPLKKRLPRDRGERVEDRIEGDRSRVGLGGGDMRPVVERGAVGAFSPTEERGARKSLVLLSVKAFVVGVGVGLGTGVVLGVKS